ncbi:PHP domain-containing protein [Halobaculum sp. EA56]|uniref:PHP domain-containing protein n=1 Tax=Halobaculum sp. EA56 TaxID=3421648 RepID=UPI003EB7BCCB
MLADLHVHTAHSHDSWATVEDVLDAAEQRDLEAIAITDHDTVTGAKEARKLADSRDITVIPGVERTVPVGKHGVHLIGLHVDQLPPNDEVISVVESIHDQGGVVVVPHPFRVGTGLLDHAKNGTIQQSAAESVLERADLLEVLNWKDSRSAISKTLEFAQESNHNIVAGTDAHTSTDVGKLTNCIHSPQTIKEGSKITVPVDDPTTVSINNLPERLLGRSTRSKDSPIRTQLISLTADVMDFVPGNEPNHTVKKVLQRARATFEMASANESDSDAWVSSVVLSRSQDETSLRLEATNTK